MDAPISMPAGAWFSVIGNIRIGAGGQTRVALRRQWLFHEHLGLDFPFLTYNPVATYDDVRAAMREQGLLHADATIHNLHEWLRVTDVGEGGGEPLPTLDGEADLSDDGVIWRVRGSDHWDYLRPDGTRYARTPADEEHGFTAVLDREGRVVDSFDGLGGLWRWWTRRMIPATGDVFLISDSRFIATELGLLDDPRIVLMHQMHNPHVVGRRHWNSPIEPSYAESMQTLDRLDALNTLTQRQGDDLAKRFGPREQFEVVANPVEVPALPDPAPTRVPERIVMLARLHAQKRIDLALDAFALLAPLRPDARLDVYGDGPDEEALRAQITRLGLSDRVTLHGFSPDAVDELWTADVAWVTSAFEGYPLNMLEARARRCPVLAFDVPYGPSEQTEDGVDGVLVPAGDVQTLAQRTAELFADRDRLEAMRDRARAGAETHGHASFLEAWRDIATRSLLRKPDRTHLDAVDVDVRTYRAGGPWQLEATVTVTGTGVLDDVRIVWRAHDTDANGPYDLPVDVVRDGNRFAVRGAVAHVDGLGPEVRSRLQLTWHNSGHTVALDRPAPKGRMRQRLKAVRERFR